MGQALCRDRAPGWTRPVLQGPPTIILDVGLPPEPQGTGDFLPPPPPGIGVTVLILPLALELSDWVSMWRQLTYFYSKCFQIPCNLLSTGHPAVQRGHPVNRAHE